MTKGWSFEVHPFGLVWREPPGETCGTCAWHFRGGRGPKVSRCRQAENRRVDPAWRACVLWEPELDCQACAACCREAYHSVTISRREPIIRTHPALVVFRDGYIELGRKAGHCIALLLETPCPADLAPSDAKIVEALAGVDSGRFSWQHGRFACTVYDSRPRACREFERAGPHCRDARRRVGL